MPILTNFPDDQSSVIALADWMEVNTLLDPDGSTSIQELSGVLSNGEGSEPDQIEVSPSELMAQAVMVEINDRAISGGDEYPFEVQGELVVAKANHESLLAYKFCLLVSFVGVTDSRLTLPHNKITKEFEHLCEYVTKKFLSNDTMLVSTKVFGWPREDKSQFLAALEEVCRESVCMKTQHTAAAGAAKDAGLDIVAWSKFPDNLAGGILFLGQCATGQDWDGKLHEISAFSIYVDIHVSHLTAIFIPHLVDSKTELGAERWITNSMKAGRIFDRSRIAYLAHDWENTTVRTFLNTSLAALKVLP